LKELDLVKNDLQIKEIIKSNLGILNEKARNYIHDIIILINREIGINKILSILVFGSQSSKNNENSIFSDCDLLIIFKDRVSDHHLKEIERYFLALELKHNLNVFDYGSKVFKKIIAVIQQTTGMFISHFLTKKKYWEERNFSKIFRVNRVVSDLFAPKNIVLRSVIDNSIILYGNDLRKDIIEQIPLPIFDLLKSIVMNLFLTVFALLISPLKELNPIKYSLEAVKWTLRASNYYGFKDTPSLKRIIKRFLLLEKSHGTKKRAREYFDTFLNLRKWPYQNYWFMFQSLYRIVKIHVFGILFQKMMNDHKKSIS